MLKNHLLHSCVICAKYLTITLSESGNIMMSLIEIQYTPDTWDFQVESEIIPSNLVPQKSAALDSWHLRISIVQR